MNEIFGLDTPEYRKYLDVLAEHRIEKVRRDGILPGISINHICIRGVFYKDSMKFEGDCFEIDPADLQ